MAVNPIGLFSQSTGKVSGSANGQLGKSDFLKMLTTQMRYQDPLNPMDNTQMVAQMAQFSQLEQMLNMSNAFTGLQSVSLLGRTIKATAIDGSLITGVVTSVDMNQDTPVMSLADGSIVALKDVQEVTN
jgi:flagellar basal-body rod modification protein FlgD